MVQFGYEKRSAAHDSASRKIGQVPISWDPDEDAAIERAHVAIVQIGDEQQDRFLAEAAQPPLEGLRALA